MSLVIQNIRPNYFNKEGLKCSNLQSGSLHLLLYIITNILLSGCMYNKVLRYNLLIKSRVQLYLYSSTKYN